jgi:hypothetical protein
LDFRPNIDTCPSLDSDYFEWDYSNGEIFDYLPELGTSSEIPTGSEHPKFVTSPEERSSTNTESSEETVTNTSESSDSPPTGNEKRDFSQEPNPNLYCDLCNRTFRRICDLK